jgi:hypothetical protein
MVVILYFQQLPHRAEVEVATAFRQIRVAVRLMDFRGDREAAVAALIQPQLVRAARVTLVHTVLSRVMLAVMETLAQTLAAEAVLAHSEVMQLLMLAVMAEQELLIPLQEAQSSTLAAAAAELTALLVWELRAGVTVVKETQHLQRLLAQQILGRAAVARVVLRPRHQVVTVDRVL